MNYKKILFLTMIIYIPLQVLGNKGDGDSAIILMNDDMQVVNLHPVNPRRAVAQEDWQAFSSGNCKKIKEKCLIPAVVALMTTTGGAILWYISTINQNG